MSLFVNYRKRICRAIIESEKKVALLTELQMLHEKGSDEYNHYKIILADQRQITELYKELLR